MQPNPKSSKAHSCVSLNLILFLLYPVRSITHSEEVKQPFQVSAHRGLNTWQLWETIGAGHAHAHGQDPNPVLPPPASAGALAWFRHSTSYKDPESCPGAKTYCPIHPGCLPETGVAFSVGPLEISTHQ